VGAVFELAANGAESVLYSFAGGNDGKFPVAGLIMDKAGNLYGTTPQGGLEHGTVFQVSPGGVETRLYSFTGGSDGANFAVGNFRRVRCP
jgi:uncharacterized repeat protein (TIGR03803 family)